MSNLNCLIFLCRMEIYNLFTMLYNLLDVVAGQGAGEIDQAGFVGDGKERTGHAAGMVGHEQNPLVRDDLCPGARQIIPRFPMVLHPSSPVARARGG